MTTVVSEFARGIALAAGAARTITGLGISITYRLRNEVTGGAGALLEYIAPPHFPGPPPHWQKPKPTGIPPAIRIRNSISNSPICRPSAKNF